MEKLLRLATMVLCDRKPGHPTPWYLVGETADNQDSVFSRGCFPSWSEPPLAITGGVTTGYPGADAWVDTMVKNYEVKRERIHVIPMNEQLNTFTEMQALVRYAEKVGWNELTIVAAPFHQLRAFLSLLGAMKRLGRVNPCTLWVYNTPGVALRRQEKALHSQGTLTATREDLIGTELERIKRYTAQGDLVTVDEALLYFRLRDQLTRE